MGQQQRARTHARSRRRGFAASMAATDDDDVVGVLCAHVLALHIGGAERSHFCTLKEISALCEPRDSGLENLLGLIARFHAKHVNGVFISFA